MVIYWAPRIHPNIIGRLETEILRPNILYVISNFGKYRFETIEQLHFTINKNFENTDNRKLYSGYWSRTNGFIEVLKIVRFNHRKEAKIIIRDVYSLYFLTLCFIGKLFVRNIIIVYQHPIHRSKPKRFLNLVVNSLGLIFKLESNVIGEGPYKLSFDFYPLLISRYFYKYSKPTNKIPNSCLLIGKYQTRKNILETLHIIKDKFSTINVVGLIHENGYYEKCISTYSNYPNIIFHTNYAYAKVIELLNISEYFILNSDDEPAAFSPIEAILSNCMIYVKYGNGTNSYFSSKSTIIFSSVENISIISYSDSMKIINRLKHEYRLIIEDFVLESEDKSQSSSQDVSLPRTPCNNGLHYAS